MAMPGYKSDIMGIYMEHRWHTAEMAAVMVSDT